MTSEILWGNSSEGIGNSVPVWVFEKEDFKKKFQEVLDVLSGEKLSSQNRSGTRDQKNIWSMSDEELIADLYCFDSEGHIIYESQYIRALCSMIARRMNEISRIQK